MQTGLSQQQQLLFRQIQDVNSRLAPFEPLLVSATSEGTANTFATVAEKKAMLVKRLIVRNSTGVMATLSLNVIPASETAATRFVAVDGYMVPANDMIDISGLIAGYYATGSVIGAWSGTSNALVLSGHYEDIL